MKTKLCLVSILYRGKREMFLVEVPVNESGKAEVSTQQLDTLIREAGVTHGTTFCIGG